MFIRKYLFLITFLLSSIVHKGVLYLLEKGGIELSHRFTSIVYFIGSLIVVGLEFLLIGYTLLFCVNENKSVRCVGFVLLTILLSVSLIGVLSHYQLLN